MRLARGHDPCFVDVGALHHELFEQVMANISVMSPKPSTIYYSRQKLELAASQFLQHFPGEVAFAVKCIPNHTIIDWLLRLGIRSFDVASMNEIKFVSQIARNSRLHFNNPIKTREEILAAYAQFNVRSFASDSMTETEKILSLCHHDVLIATRVAVPSGSQSYDFTTKFGCSIEEGIQTAKLSLEQTGQYALSFHVGSQCTDVRAYANGLSICRTISDHVGSEPKIVNIGGGFPVFHDECIAATTKRYLKSISQFAEVNDFRNLVCEPGRAMVAASGVAALQVRSVSNDRIFLSDGVYGILGEINHIDCDFPIKDVVSSPSKNRSKFRLFGPTCDSFDRIDRPAILDKTIAETDWILIGNMGAYSWSLNTAFNGFIDRDIIHLQ